MPPVTPHPTPSRPPLRRPAPLGPALLAGLLAALLAGCAPTPLRQGDPLADTRAELQAQRQAQPAPPARPEAAAPGQAAPAAAPAPAAPAAAAPAPAPEPRFDLIVHGAQARDVFLSMVAETRYSMLMHPEVAGTLSVTLRGVTLREALESIRDVYGYDFRIEGRRVTVFPPSLQTRIFTVNYLQTKRQGRSEVRVSGSGAPANGDSAGGGAAGATGSAGRAGNDSSQITTTSSSDIWGETVDALRLLLGKGEGRQVIASPQASTIVVRGMPAELHQVDQFLRASRMAVERQVMLEAKIIEVELREGYEGGIDWAAFREQGSSAVAAGQVSGAGPDTLRADLARRLSGGALGLVLGTRNFAAALTFVETQGELQVLSSPRVATLNNQKAVLKVGVDEYFVTNVSGGSITTGTASSSGTTTLPSLTLTPFFSGIALDVTPQIDDASMITLHIRPSVTSVTEKTKQIDLGTIGNYRLPLASSSVNETDTVVRVTDGEIVAIGGLMQSESARRSSGVPGAGRSALGRTLLSSSADSGRKKELVVLIKPTILRSTEDWQRASDQALAALQDSDAALPRRVITLDARTAPPAGPASASADVPAAPRP